MMYQNMFDWNSQNSSEFQLSEDEKQKRFKYFDGINPYENDKRFIKAEPVNDYNPFNEFKYFDGVNPYAHHDPFYDELKQVFGEETKEEDSQPTEELEQNDGERYIDIGKVNLFNYNQHQSMDEQYVNQNNNDYNQQQNNYTNYGYQDPNSVIQQQLYAQQQQNGYYNQQMNGYNNYQQGYNYYPQMNMNYENQYQQNNPYNQQMNGYTNPQQDDGVQYVFQQNPYANMTQQQNMNYQQPVYDGQNMYCYNNGYYVDPNYQYQQQMQMNGYGYANPQRFINPGYQNYNQNFNNYNSNGYGNNQSLNYNYYFGRNPRNMQHSGAYQNEDGIYINEDYDMNNYFKSNLPGYDEEKMRKYYDPFYQRRKMMEEIEKRRQAEIERREQLDKQMKKAYYAYKGIDYTDEMYQQDRLEQMKKWEEVQRIKQANYEYDSLDPNGFIMGEPPIQNVPRQPDPIDNMSFTEFIADMGHQYMLLLAEKAKRERRNVKQLYDTNKYRELLNKFQTDHEGARKDFLQMCGLDDIEVKLPAILQTKTEERRKKFMDAITELENRKD